MIMIGFIEYNDMELAHIIKVCIPTLLNESGELLLNP